MHSSKIKYLFLLFIILASKFYGLSQGQVLTESELKEYWEKNGAEEIEGIYVLQETVINCNGLGNCRESSNKYENKFYILKQNGEFIFAQLGWETPNKLVNISGSKTYMLDVSSAEWFSVENKKITLMLKLGDGNQLVSDKVNFYQDLAKLSFIDKFLPVYKPKAKPEIKHLISSGTGFAISSNGIIVTNYHVLQGGIIRVKGVNADFNKIYKARLLISDKNNDLAIIQITDNNFVSIGKIPYTVKSGLSNVGDDVFVLGYPLRASMGDEIKLTNGIISSKTGFQGDITTYQISAPVQPGNSGGPLFDLNGNLIGIVNAKHIDAENVSYAIKVNYLSSLISMLENPITFPVNNLLQGKSLAKQSEIVKRFVYIIESE